MTIDEVRSIQEAVRRFIALNIYIARRTAGMALNHLNKALEAIEPQREWYDSDLEFRFDLALLEEVTEILGSIRDARGVETGILEQGNEVLRVLLARHDKYQRSQIFKEENSYLEEIRKRGVASYAKV